MGSRIQIHRIAGDLMAVNSFVVVGPTGTVVVDAMLTIADATKVHDAVAAAGRPLAGVVITHGHPDHYAGLKHVTGGADVPILAAAAVNEVIRADDAVKAAIVGPMMGEQWPPERLFPNTVAEPGASVELGGVALRMEDIGPAESRHDTIWHLDDVSIFAGDLAYSRTHAYLYDGMWEAWLAALSKVNSELKPGTTLYVGHGAPAGAELLAAQRAYIETFIQAISDTLDRDETSRHDEVVRRMRRLVPGDDLLFLMELSIEPVALKLRS